MRLKRFRPFELDLLRRLTPVELKLAKEEAILQTEEEKKYNRVSWLSWRKEIKFEDLPLWKQIEARRLGWR